MGLRDGDWKSEKEYKQKRELDVKKRRKENKREEP